MHTGLCTSKAGVIDCTRTTRKHGRPVTIDRLEAEWWIYNDSSTQRALSLSAWIILTKQNFDRLTSINRKLRALD